MIRFALLFSVLFAACGSDRAQVATGGSDRREVAAAGASKSAVKWSEIQGGLRVSLEVASPVKLSPPAQGSQEVIAKIHVENTSAAPVRILHIRPEPFRLFHSSLRVWGPSKVVSLQPEAHPHGYLLTEEDFLLIAAKATTTYDQTLYLSDALAQPGTFEVELMFENTMNQFPGGARTLDGVTKPLFGGVVLTDLWTGKLSVRTPLIVAR